MIAREQRRILLERKRPGNIALHAYGNYLWIWAGRLEVIGPTREEPGLDAHPSGIANVWYGRASADGRIATLYAPSVRGTGARSIFPNTRPPKILMRALLRRWPEIRTLRLYTAAGGEPEEVLI